MLELIKELRALGATEIEFDTCLDSGTLRRVVFGPAQAVSAPVSFEMQNTGTVSDGPAHKITVRKPEGARMDWYKAVAGLVSE